MARFIDELKRTHDCGALRASNEGQVVVLFGWVAGYRDHGGCVFIDLRDREGITQLVFDPELSGHGDLPKQAYELARALRNEWVVGIRGVVFFDAGNAWNTEQQFCATTPAPQFPHVVSPCFNASSLESVRTSTGFGIRWFSPLGPLRFEWGFPLEPLPYEEKYVFEFTIGNFF